MKSRSDFNGLCRWLVLGFTALSPGLAAAQPERGGAAPSAQIRNTRKQMGHSELPAPLPYVEQVVETAPANEIPMGIATFPSQSPSNVQEGSPSDPQEASRLIDESQLGRIAVPAQRQSIEIWPEQLVIRAFEHSARVVAIQAQPQVTATSVVEADATFDWVRFWDTTWDDLNDPVGSTLTTGTADRYKDRNIYGNLGVRRRNSYGGDLQISQRLGHQNTNSDFFIPNDQGSARLTISYSHPLLRGRGQKYNRSVVVLAKMDVGIAEMLASQELQSHLIDVVRAYWSLYQEHRTLQIREKLLEDLESLMVEINARRSIDTYSSQVARADSAVAQAKSTLVRARAGVRFAEARIRALVNDPALGLTGAGQYADQLAAAPHVSPQFQCFSPPMLVPLVRPIVTPLLVDACDATEAALRQRPEVLEALHRVKQGAVRRDLTKNELLPQLNLVTSTYTSGLKGNSGVFPALGAQFSEGRPGYSVGLQYEVPFGNRAAQARHKARLLDLRRLQSEFRATTEIIVMEATNAVGEVQASIDEVALKNESVRAATIELEALVTRWRAMIQQANDPGLVLNDILRAQERLVDVRLELLNSEIAYSLAVVELQRAMGSFLTAEDVVVSIAKTPANN